MPKMKWVVPYRFCSKFCTLSSSAKILKENRLRFDKVTDSLKVGTFFETVCIVTHLSITDHQTELCSLYRTTLYSL